ncbi:MAG TPA: formate dehydrogenase [Burkholderiaceae bacterium]|nr:formate dehydrogenase [Burkholderiaceae bacterium]
MTNSPPNNQSKSSRRGFFLTAGVAGAAVTTVSVLKSPAPEAIAEVLKPAPEKGGGYQLTEHVKQYYKTAMV